MIKNILKFLLVVGVFYLLSKKGLISFSATAKAFDRLDLVLPAFALQFSTSVFSIIRWQWILQAQKVNLPWLRTIQLIMIGTFFNTALPGAVSGDLVKAFYVAKEVPASEGHTQSIRGRVFGSILFDRILGLAALVLVSASAVVWNWSDVGHSPLLKGIQAFMVTAALCVIAFFSYLFLMREKHDPVLRFLKWCEHKNKKAGSFLRVYEGVRHYHFHRWVTTKGLLLSLGNHIFVATACYLFAQALGEDFVQLGPVMIVVPLGLLVTAIPVLPGGVGTGHAAFAALFALFGSQRGADVFSLFILSQLMLSAIGGVVYLKFKAKNVAQFS